MKRGLVLVLFLVLGALALRGWELEAQSLWSDEGLSLYRARLPLTEILSNTITVDGQVTQDTNPPLYFLLLHLVRAVAGESVFALRYLGTARTGAYFALAPFIGALIALALGEPLTLKLALAALLMGLGLWLHLTERHEHDHVHEALAHEHRHVHDEHHQHPHDGPVTEPHSHWHEHMPMRHKHPHYPDLHHRHEH